MQVIENSTNSLRLYRDLMAKKFKESEGLYYGYVDDLTEKLGDLDFHGDTPVPGFEIRQFDFIKDWEYGEISSADVHFFLKKMNPSDVAEKHLTRKLTNYMFQNEEAANYIKCVLPEIKSKVLPVYTRYLHMLTSYFNKLAIEDAKQEPVTWLEVAIQVDGSFKTSIKDMPINQAINILDTYFIHDVTENGHYLGNNTLVIPEEAPDGTGVRATQWLFAPAEYISLLKGLYDVDKELDLESDGAYIHGIIKGYAV